MSVNHQKLDLSIKNEFEPSKIDLSIKNGFKPSKMGLNHQKLAWTMKYCIYLSKMGLNHQKLVWTIKSWIYLSRMSVNHQKLYLSTNKLDVSIKNWLESSKIGFLDRKWDWTEPPKNVDLTIQTCQKFGCHLEFCPFNVWKVIRVIQEKTRTYPGVWSKS